MLVCGITKIDVNIDGDKLLECTSEESKLLEQRIHRKHLFNLPTFNEETYESCIKNHQGLEARLRKK